jgi:hypothetical protein
MIVWPRTFATAAVLVTAIFTIAGTAEATVICSSPTSNPADVVCTQTGLTNTLDLEQRVIGTGAHARTFTFEEVPEEQRPEGWFLGNPSIQSCSFCLAPNRQNMARKRELDRARGLGAE